MTARQPTSSSKTNRSFTHYFDPPNPENSKPLTVKQLANIYELRQIKEYENNSRPQLNQEKRRLIQEKLELDKEAEVATNARLKDEDLFVKYQYNPFVRLESRGRKQSLFSSKRDDHQDSYGTESKKSLQSEDDGNIVDALNRLKHNKFQKNTKQFENNMAQTKLLSSQIITNAQRLNYNKPKPKVDQELHQEQIIRNLDIEDIIDMKDENFFNSKQKTINIFAFMKGGDSNIATNNILDRYYFSHTSMVEKIEKVRFPTYRELSRVGRLFIRNKNPQKQTRLDMINSNEITFKANDIRIQDILSIASGRFTPDIVYKAINDGEVRQEVNIDSSSVEEEIVSISYNDKARHYMTNFENTNVSRQEIIDYFRLGNTPQQDRYAAKCEKIYKNIADKLIHKTDLFKNTIQDNRLHKGIDNTIDEEIEYFTDMDRNPYIETDRLIRQNKNRKDRHQHIKVEKLLDTLTVKREQEQIMRKLVGKPNK